MDSLAKSQNLLSTHLFCIGKVYTLHSLHNTNNMTHITQTAVEWLIQALDESNIVDLNWIDSDRYYAIIEQAKEMEKEQVINAYKNGQKIVEQYYK